MRDYHAKNKPNRNFPHFSYCTIQWRFVFVDFASRKHPTASFIKAFHQQNLPNTRESCLKSFVKHDRFPNLCEFRVEYHCTTHWHLLLVLGELCENQIELLRVRSQQVAVLEHCPETNFVTTTRHNRITAFRSELHVFVNAFRLRYGSSGCFGLT